MACDTNYLQVLSKTHAPAGRRCHNERLTMKQQGNQRRTRTRGNRTTGAINYRLPALWDCWGYAGEKRMQRGEILVDPRDYMTACFEWIRSQPVYDTDYIGRSLAQIMRVTETGARPRPRLPASPPKRQPHGGDWIAHQTIYGMMIRMTTAWDHDANGRLSSPAERQEVASVPQEAVASCRALEESCRYPERGKYQELGTFLKSCLLMPLLARMGITTLYLLPVVKVSNLFRKGELGCPYSARNFLELDAGQHDPLFGHDGPEAVNDEFAIFVECAHRLGMRVMLDLAPRTAARDCDWILERPDWFYWIDRRYARSWSAPVLEGIQYGTPIPRRLGEIYERPSVRKHLAKFRFAPSVTHPAKWKQFVTRVRRQPPADLMRAIGDTFGVITPPGFSDVINDPQPPWSDVTYFRLYQDHPPEAAELLDDPVRQPPYVLFDTIKSNVFPARKPNRRLWDRIASILPFYQRFGIDGARIDMAHALPRELERMILDRPRKIDPDFCFFAEDLGYHNHANIRRAGYNIVLGPSWHMQPRAAEGRMHKMLGDLPTLKVPILATAETPDTPRAVVRKGGRAFSRQSVVVNMFLPNAVPMINSGVEVFERQPMNLGLEIGKPGRFALPKSDPQYGKLAFFDRYALHWTNRGGPEMVDLIGRAAAIRQRYIKSVARKSAYFAPTIGMNARHVLATAFSIRGSHKTLLMLANLDLTRARRTTVLDLLSPRTPQVLLEIKSSATPRLDKGRLFATLPPGDVKVMLV